MWWGNLYIGKNPQRSRYRPVAEMPPGERAKLDDRMKKSVHTTVLGDMMMTKTHEPGQHNEFLKRMGESELRSTLKNLRRHALGFQKDYVGTFDFIADPYFGNLLTDHNKDARKKRPAISIKYLEQRAASRAKEERAAQNRLANETRHEQMQKHRQDQKVEGFIAMPDTERQLLPRPNYLDKITGLRKHAAACFLKDAGMGDCYLKSGYFSSRLLNKHVNAKDTADPTES